MNFIFSEKIYLSTTEYSNFYNTLLYLDTIINKAKNPETIRNAKEAILALERGLDKSEFACD